MAQSADFIFASGGLLHFARLSCNARVLKRMMFALEGWAALSCESGAETTI